MWTWRMLEASMMGGAGSGSTWRKCADGAQRTAFLTLTLPVTGRGVPGHVAVDVLHQGLEFSGLNFSSLFAILFMLNTLCEPLYQS